MSHRHTWQVAAYVLLALPVDDWSERSTVWVCRACGVWCHMTALTRHRWPLETPEFWTAADSQAAGRERRARRRER
jgi:hypothetical protein